jgi:hypothetical protein
MAPATDDPRRPRLSDAQLQRVDETLRFLHEPLELGDGLSLTLDGEEWELQSNTGPAFVAIAMTEEQLDRLVDGFQAKRAASEELSRIAASAKK